MTTGPAFLRRLLPGLAALLLCLPAQEVSARAGGGEHYSGGSSRSSSRSSSSGSSRGSSSGWSSSSGGGSSYVGRGDSGDGLFTLIFWLVRTTFRHPLVMVPFWIVVFLIARQFLRNAVQSAPLDKLPRVLPDVGPGLEALKARDPAFSKEAFEARAGRVFLTVQEAWFRRDFATARTLMSDGLYRRFRVLQGLMTRESRRDAVADPTVLSSRIAAVSKSDAFDAVTVAIMARLRDAEVAADLSDEEALAAAKSATPEVFTEYWTFLRRVEAITVEGKDLSNGTCPNCGAPFEGGASGKCPYCDAIVNSGRHDWVLSEITQAGEFVIPEAPALDALRSSDPALASEVIEDRALLTFWKWLEAYGFEEPARVRRLSRSDVVDEVTADIAKMRNVGQPVVLATPAVGGADLLAVSRDDDGFDRVCVDVRWSAAAAFTPQDSLGRVMVRPRRHVLRLSRKSGATSAASGLATDRCGHCLAPLSDSDVIACPHCGVDLTSGAHDWVLEEVVPYDVWRLERPTDQLVDPRMATANERRRVLQLLTAMAKADGVVDASERRLLKSCARRWGVQWSDVEVLLAADSALEMDGLGGLGEDARQAMLIDLEKMLRADGRFDRREQQLMETVSRRWAGGGRA